MIPLSEVLTLHKLLIHSFGGTEGVRDKSSLSSALQRPFQTFDGKLVYKSVLEQAAALVESILINHPFIDGNKRTGYVLLRSFLIQNNTDITASEEQKYDFIISIASGDLKFDGIVSWLYSHTASINRM